MFEKMLKGSNSLSSDCGLRGHDVLQNKTRHFRADPKGKGRMPRNIKSPNASTLADQASVTSDPQDKRPQNGKSESQKQETKKDQTEAEKFIWRENWYPAKIISWLPKDRPNKVVILNEEIVIWWGEDNEWHAARDRCPHKLAPMSEGRMDNGVLECRYHGWQFSSQGKCTFSPQAAAVPRACLDMYPTQVVHGMLWIWPQNGGDAFLKASSKKVPVDDSFAGPILPGFSSDYFYLKSGADWSMMIDNGMDPSHAPALHESQVGNRKSMVEMNMKVEEVHPTRGVRLTHNGYLANQHADDMTAERTFSPPCLLRATYSGKSGPGMDSAIYITPERPGTSHVFTKFLFRQPKQAPKTSLVSTGLQRTIMATIPKIVRLLGIDNDVALHINGQDLGNQDALMMHTCQKNMVDPADKSTLKHSRFTLASRADIGIGAFWRWVDKYGGHPWEGGASFAQIPQDSSREALFSQYERHTRHCPKCMTALAKVESWIKTIDYCMAAAVAVAIIFKDSTAIKVSMLGGAASLFLIQKGLSSVRQKFYGKTKLPDE